MNVVKARLGIDPVPEGEKWHAIHFTAMVRCIDPRDVPRALLNPALLSMYGLEPYEGTFYIDSVTAYPDEPIYLEGVPVVNTLPPPPPVWKQRLMNAWFLPRRWRWGTNLVENESFETDTAGWSGTHIYLDDVQAAILAETGDQRLADAVCDRVSGPPVLGGAS